jgi:hypothetical protein
LDFSCILIGISLLVYVPFQMDAVVEMYYSQVAEELDSKQRVKEVTGGYDIRHVCIPCIFVFSFLFLFLYCVFLITHELCFMLG